ncbi:MAG: PASTA domain-containing protein, partial [Ignavibacteria bacterium]|nr:PASTA domain-containing protein [Ignavibacteria bacterium]
MARRKKKLFARLKLPAVVLGVALLLFFLLDNVVMPRYVQQGKTTKVPHVVGKKLDEALQILAVNGLVGKKAEVRTDKRYPEGTVVQQNPAADSEVKFGR